jgi:multidrug resistance efflux pump
MLNISPYPKKFETRASESKSMLRLNPERRGKKLIRNFFIGIVALIGVLLLPWTQNVSAPGKVISRYPDKKPQQVNTMIDGRIAKWYVYEGQVIEKGDTLLRLEEVKPEYLDPQLVERTQDLIDAKSMAIEAYGEKLVALRQQEEALIQSREFELAQARLKVRQSRQKVLADSAAVEQAQLDVKIAQQRLERAEELYYKDGLLTTTDFESRSLKRQEAEAKLVKADNDLASSRQSLEMASIEVNRKAAEYADKIAKNRSDQASTSANLQDARAERTKLDNTLANYERRQTGQIVLAPQGGRVIQTLSSGVGEIVKSGTAIATIQPLDFVEACELYVEAMDVPLMHKGAHVRLQFDGWPALVFSGWPSASVGTFAGEVVSVDQVINDRGKYRVIIIPDPAEGDGHWPRPLSIGSGAFGMVLLKNVPLGYELWRQLNGFPPEFYTASEAGNKQDKGEKK